MVLASCTYHIIFQTVSFSCTMNLMTLQKTISDYQMSPETQKVVADTRLLLIASIAGGGKDTVVRELVKTGYYHRIVSHTTRQPRGNHGVMEVHGQDYHFIDLATAQQMLSQQAFVEAKYVHGNVYGTSLAEVKKAHVLDKIAVTDIDIQGVAEYLDVKPDTHAVFLLPPSVDTWLSRLGSRYGNLEAHKAEVHKRFQTARTEIMHILQDKRFVVIVNDDLETTVRRVRGVVTGEVDHTSGYAATVAEHLLDYLNSTV